jgi:hypothetical protein
LENVIYADWMHFRYLDGGGADLEGAFTVGTGSPTMPGRPGRRAFNRFNAKNQEAFSGGSQMIMGGIHGLLKLPGVSSPRTPSSLRRFLPARRPKDTRGMTDTGMAKWVYQMTPHGEWERSL